MCIAVSGHHTKRGWAERALQRLQEQLAPLGVERGAGNGLRLTQIPRQSLTRQPGFKQDWQ